MKTLVVFAHPERKSFNGALLDVAIEVFSGNGHEIQVSDLYAMGFDPVSDRRNFLFEKDPDYFKQQIEEMHASETAGFSADVRAEMEKLAWCDLVIFQFPLWWFSLPAIMKGWVDRTFAMGWAYGRGKWFDDGVFAGKRALLSVTTGGGASGYEPSGLHGDMESILYPINHGIFRFVGFDVLEPFVSYSPAHIGEEARGAILESYRARLGTVFHEAPIAYPSLSDYDESFKLKPAVRAQ